MAIPRKVNKDFFKTWSIEMAYVLGFFLADGSLTKSKRGNHYFSFYSADRDLLLMIREAMGSAHRVARRSTESGTVYRIQIGSKEMFEDLESLGLTPRKTNRLVLPNVPDKFFASFVRGYFDGDGNVWMGTINNKRKKPTKVIQVSFTSGCQEFLECLLRELKKRGIRGGSLFSVKAKNCQRLTLSTLDALKVHEIMYNVPSKLCLERKKRVFEQFVKMRT